MHFDYAVCILTVQYAFLLCSVQFDCAVGWSVKFQRDPVHARQSFHFQKTPGGLNINIFCENWYEASLYNKEQSQKYKFEIWVSKLFYF